jgi:hypothetical protein
MSNEPGQVQDDPLLHRVLCGCEILALISQGGMGKLYRARQLSLDRVVAVKVLAPSLSANSEFLGRFRREARSLANLVHPNIVAVHDFGSEGDTHAIVMEYVEGESVADVLARTNLIPMPTAVAIVRQVADGLAAAHAKGIIHCDLKPENILVTPAGVAKVVDFGLAKSFRGDAMRVTQDGAILGTPTYMSPEQCEGAPLDGRTDLYSLGATFYRMVAGRDTFEGENAFAIMLKHQNEPPADPRRHNPSIPPAVASAILRMLEKPREKRYQDAVEIVKALCDIERAAAAEGDSAESVEHPRRELTIAREALEAGLVTPRRLRKALARHQEATGKGTASDLPTILVREGVLSEEQLRVLAERTQAREEARGDEQFARMAVEAGMATREQVEECLRRQRPSPGARSEVKLSKVMVEAGILKPQQVVDLLLRQLKAAQQREDAELVELLHRERALNEQDLKRCVEEQERQEVQGRPKVLRQIIVELGMLPAARLRSLLRKKTREDIEQFLREREAAGRTPAGPIMPDETQLKLDEEEPCPACGHMIPVESRRCPACGVVVEEARREAGRRGATVLVPEKPAPPPPPGRGAQAAPPAAKQAAKAAPRPHPAAGPKPAPKPADQWEIRLPSGDASKPLPFAALVKLARERRLTPRTVLRGPLTRGIWRQARHAPTLCRLFGSCHYCEAKLPPNAKECPTCHADPDRPHVE